MDTDKLKAAKTEIEGRFNNLREQHTNLEIELNKVQGEWRAVVNFIKQLEPQDGSVEPPSEAQEIPVTVVPTAEVSA